MVSIINYANKTISGSLFTLTDLQLELQKYIGVKTYMKFFNLDNTREYKKLFNIKSAIDAYCLIEYDLFDASNDHDIIITSYYVLSHMDISELKTKHLIVLDSLDVYNDYINENIHKTIEKISGVFDNVYLMFNTFNYNLCKKLDMRSNIHLIEYFSKISSTRVDTLNESIDERMLIRVGDLCNKYGECFLYNNRYEFLNTLKFKGFAFSRMNHLAQGITVENIGKLLFEYMYMGKYVDYYPDNKIIDDGLHYYMEKIGLNSNDVHIDVSVPRDILMKEIFFNKDDYIIVLINKILEKDTAWTKK